LLFIRVLEDYFGAKCRNQVSVSYITYKMLFSPELARAKWSVGCCWPSPVGYKRPSAVHRAPASPADFSGPNHFLSSVRTEDDKNCEV